MTNTELLDLMRARADGGRAKKRGWVGLRLAELAEQAGMSVADTSRALSDLSRDGLVAYTLRDDGDKVRIRVTEQGLNGGLASDAEPPVIQPDGPDARLLVYPWYLQGLPSILALVERDSAMKQAAALLSDVASDELKSLLQLEAQTLSRLEREVLSLLARLDGGE